MKIKTFQTLMRTLIIGLLINGIAFAFFMHQNHLIIDDWVWIERVLIPLRAGDLSLFEAITWEFSILSHSHIPALAFMILNERFFGYNTRLFLIVGVSGMLLCFYTLLRYLQKNESFPGGNLSTDNSETLSLNSHIMWIWGLLLLGTSGLFNIAPTLTYVNSLMMFEHLYLAIAIGYLYAFQKLTRERRPILLSALMALTLLFGDAMGVGAVLSSLVGLALLTVFDRSYLKPSLIIYAVFIGCYFLYKTYIPGQSDHLTASHIISADPQMLDILPDRLKLGLALLGDVDKEATLTRYAYIGKYILTNPADSFTALFNLSGEGFLLPHSTLNMENKLTRFIGAIWLIYTIGLSLMVLLKNRITSKNIFPLTLIGFSLVCILGVIFLRLTFYGPDTISGDRHYKFLFILSLGNAFLLFDLWKAKKRAWMTYLFIVLLGLNLGNTVLSTPYAWKTVAAENEKTAQLNQSLGEFARGENNDYLTKNLACFFNDQCRVVTDYFYSYDILPGVDNPDID